MKISTGELGSLWTGGQNYDSRLPSDEILSDAWAGAARSILSDANVAALYARDGGYLAQSVLGLVGTQIGIPSEFMGSFDQLISSAAFNQPIEKVAFDVAKAALDVYLEAMGAIPFVGPVAKIGLGIVEGIVTAQEGGVPPPPMATYNRAVNNDFAAHLLDLVGAPESSPELVDWTPIFTPPGTGAWEVLPRDAGSAEPGHAWRVAGVNVEASGAGMDGRGIVPGGLVACIEPQTKPIDISYLQGVKGAWTARGYEVATNLNYDLSGMLPSFQNAGAAAWEAVSSKTAAMFNVDVRGLGKAWVEYVEGAMQLRAEVMGDVLTADVIESAAAIQAVFLPFALHVLPSYGEMVALQKAAPEGGKKVWPRPTALPESLRIDRVAAKHLSDLRARQTRALDTLLCAYCSEDQPAFRDPKLLALLRERRGQLLKHPAAKRVNLDDVPDKALRTELAAAQADKQLGIDDLAAAPQQAKRGGFGPASDAPQAEGWGGESGGGGAALAAVGLGLAIALG